MTYPPTEGQIDEVVKSLDALKAGDDPEAVHALADGLLTAMVPPAIAKAYMRACERVGFWYA